jgi:hypothetical protein
MKGFRAAVCIALLACWGPAMAYEGYPLHPVHEVMTRQTYACLTRWGGAEPENCGAEADLVARQSGYRLLRDFTPGEKAATWPDDPVRELSPLTAVRYGWALKYGCARAAAGQGATYTIDRAGLMCSSHYGRLQFLHAMRSSADEPVEQTRARIRAWAALTYEVASGQADPAQDYCDYFSRPSAIADDFAPSECRGRVVNGRVLASWSLSTLFAMRCGGAFSGSTCAILADPRDVARASATGALLHLIQDSFSQSHVARGAASPAGFEARIDCAAAMSFYFYDASTSKTHGAADQPPHIAPSCRPGAEVDDAVTAGARAIWMIQHQRPLGEFTAFFDKSVLSGPVARQAAPQA